MTATPRFIAAYHAPFRDLSSPTGEPTKATFVFTQRILNLIADRKPEYLAMVIDSGDETVFRKEFFPQYKANRPSRPDDFLPQEQRIFRLVADAGIPIFVSPGFEADDIIATMAKRLTGQDFEVFIVSNDKDLRQILDDCTRMYDPYDGSVTDPASMEAKHGYRPDQAIEVQTLIGDATDNVPGIPGVGPKTAARLIHKYGTADAVLDHLDELTPKLRENFEKNAAGLAPTRKLVTLKTDVPMDFDPEACRFTGVDIEGLRVHLEECGFVRLLQRLEPQADAAGPVAPPAQTVRPAPVSGQLWGTMTGGARMPGPGVAAEKQRARPPVTATSGRFEESLFPMMMGGGDESGSGDARAATASDCRYELVQTAEQFAAFVDQLKTQKRFAFDTETDALGPMNSELVGMSFSWEAGTGYYVPICGPEGSGCCRAPMCSIRSARSWRTPTLPRSGTTSSTICSPCGWLV